MGEANSGLLSGVPFDAMEPPDFHCVNSPDASYLTRHLLNPGGRSEATAFLTCLNCVSQLSVPTTTARPSNIAMPSSLSPGRRRNGSHSSRLCLPRERISLKERPVCLSGHPTKSRRYPSHLNLSLFYFWLISSPGLRAQRNPVPCVCRANPPRPLADVVISATGLCQDPPRIDRTTPFFAGPIGFMFEACL